MWLYGSFVRGIGVDGAGSPRTCRTRLWTKVERGAEQSWVVLRERVEVLSATMRQEAASSLRRQACLEAEEAAELARSTAAQVWNELWIKSRKQRGCLAKLPERGSPGRRRERNSAFWWWQRMPSCPRREVLMTMGLGTCASLRQGSQTLFGMHAKTAAAGSSSAVLAGEENEIAG